MSTLQSIGIHLESVGNVLADNRLSVPRFQRWYSWEQEHVRDLYSDLWTSFRNKQREYFLGSIVLAHRRDATTPEVVDGQQRLTTISILIAALRDYFQKIKDPERASDVERRYLLSKDMRTRETVPHLALSDVDKDFFEKRILSAAGSTERKIKAVRDSHERIAKAANVAAEYVLKTSTTTNDSTQVLLDWLELLDKQAKVIVVEVPDDVNAFTIFETLNDRGLDLAISDLLKNFLFKQSGDRISEVQERWMTMLGVLESIDRDNIVVTYIRHLWSTRHGLTRERELYTEIKTHITSKQAAIDFATDLSESALIYNRLFNSGSQFWKTYPPAVAEDVETLNLLRMTQMRPLLMAIVAEFSHAETRDAFRMMVSWTVRFIVTGALGSGDLESNYAARSKDVRDKVILDAATLLEAMRPIIPTDADFEAEFARFKITKASVARYLISTLEQAAGVGEIELKPDGNPDIVNLEHILPESSSSNWPDLDTETAQTYHSRLGNMALMNRASNNDVGNEAFKTKQQWYSQSRLTLTKELASETNWGPVEIERRQAKMAKLAVTAWPISLPQKVS